MSTRPASLTQLVERHRAELLVYARRMLGHEQDAQDVCQDALLRACRAFGRLPGDANVRAWLYKIVTNSALTTLKRRRRTVSTVDLDIDGLPAPPDERERLRSVERAVYRLPPKQRAALMQRRVQGMSYADIAVSLDCSEAAARANVYQAVKKLRVLLEPVHSRRGER
jgi:RNA polymerase sigma-70 factor (ECF subfamily)